MTSPTIGTILSGSYGGTPFGYAFAYDSTLSAGAARPSYAVNGLVNTSLAWINPATEDTQASLLTQLQAIAASVAASPTSSDQTQLLASLASILAAIQAQRAATLWTDDTNAFFVRLDNAGAISWTTVTGATSTGPASASARPVSSETAVIDRSSYQVTSGGTGYAVGDLVDHVLSIDTATSAVLVNFWVNLTKSTIVTTIPASDISAVIPPLPQGASTAANQQLANTALGVIQAALGAALPLPQGAAADGADIAGSTMPTGGIGIRGWLSASFGKLAAIATALAGTLDVSIQNASVAVTGTFWQATQPTSTADGGSVTLGSQADAAATAVSTSGSAIAWLRGIFAAVTTIATLAQKQVPLAYTDRSSACSATAATFAIAIVANPARGFLRVSNPNSAGLLYVYDKTAGSPSVTNSITIGPGQAYVWDRGAPGGAIQIAGSVASLAYEAAEGV